MLGSDVFGEVNFYPVGRNAEELVRLLPAHIYVNKKHDEVFPARLRQGKKLKHWQNLMEGL